MEDPRTTNKKLNHAFGHRMPQTTPSLKGRKHKYGFNNNKREKPEKVRVVDDETGDKHELYEVLRMPSSTKNQ